MADAGGGQKGQNIGLEALGCLGFLLERVPAQTKGCGWAGFPAK